MRALDIAAILEKNKLSSDNAWLVLLEIQFNGITLRVVRNTENITWNGQEWVAFPFELEDLAEDKDEIPRLVVRVSNVTRVIQQYLDAAGGGTGATIIFRVVMSKHLDKPATLEERFTVLNTTSDSRWVTFTLGMEDIFGRRFPLDRHMKDFCRHKFKGLRCGYTGPETSCDHTLARCRELGNSVRFGGEVGLPTYRYV